MAFQKLFRKGIPNEKDVVKVALGKQDV